MRLSAPILLALIFCQPFVACQSQDALSWSELEARLEKEVKGAMQEGMNAGWLSGVPSYAQVKSLPPSSRKEATMRDGIPFISFCAYRSLLDDFPDESFGIALNYLKTNEANRIFRQGAVEIVSAAEPSRQNVEVLNSMLGGMVGVKDRMLVGTVISYLDSSLLVSATSKEQKSLLPATSVALIVSQLLSRHAKNENFSGETLSRLDVLLRELRFTPGYPQVIWLAYPEKDAADEEVVSVATDLLESELISDQEFLLGVLQHRKLADELMRSFDSVKSEMGTRRRSLAKHWLSGR